MDTRTYYIAGPMSYRPQFNFPLFDRVARGLRNQGWDIVSPAELDSPEIRREAMASRDGNPGQMPGGETWADFLARDVKLIADQVKGIILLPGWETSRGARLETFVSLLCDHEVLCVREEYDGSLTVWEPDHQVLKEMLYETT